MRATTAKQLEFQHHSGWGGKRDGAGRKRTKGRGRVQHSTRPGHQAAHPVHATLRALDVVGSLRDCPVLLALEAALVAASSEAFRIVHYSIQHNHLHLIIEAHDRAARIRGLQGLAIRCAKAVNRALERKGNVWADRYHARELRTPREVRAALVYVLHHWKKTVHGAEHLDPCATGFWFDGWKGPRPLWSLTSRPSPVRAPRTWLLRVGWRRLGLLGFDERPRR